MAVKHTGSALLALFCASVQAKHACPFGSCLNSAVEPQNEMKSISALFARLVLCAWTAGRVPQQKHVLWLLEQCLLQPDAIWPCTLRPGASSRIQNCRKGQAGCTAWAIINR